MSRTLKLSLVDSSLLIRARPDAQDRAAGRDEGLVDRDDDRERVGSREGVRRRGAVRAVAQQVDVLRRV